MLGQRDSMLAQRDPMLVERKAWPSSTTREASSAMPSAVSSLSHTDPLEGLKYPGRYPGSYPGSASRPIYATTSATARADLAADLAAANKAAAANEVVAAARANRHEAARRASEVGETPLEHDAPAEAPYRYDAMAEAHVQWAEREEAAAMLAALETGGARYGASPLSRSHATPSTPAYSSAFAAGGSGAAFLSRCSCRGPAPSSLGAAGHPYSTMGGVAASPRVAPPPPLPGAGSGDASDAPARRSAYDELLQRNAAPRPAAPRMSSAVPSAGPGSFTQRRDLAERAHGQRATPARPATSFGGTTMARPTLARGGVAFGA